MTSRATSQEINQQDIDVMVVGAAGKMGRLACQALTDDIKVRTVIPVLRSDCLQSMLVEHQPHILLELTDIDSVFLNTRIACEYGIPVVVGSSGLTADQLQALDALSRKKQIQILVVPNFSIAAVMMVKAARMSAEWLADCEIIEYHHAEKKDAPSATSLYTADAIYQAGQKSEGKCVASTAGYIHKSCVPIHSVRTPGFVAKQDVIFSQSGERLTLSLSQITREAFMPGVKLAVHRIRRLHAGLQCGLEAVLDLSSSKLQVSGVPS